MQDFLFKTIVDGTYMVIWYDGDEETVEIPDTYYGMPVRVIGDGVFKNKTWVKHVVIPENVMELGGFVFDGCENIETVSLPESLISIWQYAFVRSGFRELVIPEGVKNIIPFTFSECRKLERVTLLHEDVKIFSNAFRDCENLRELIVRGTPSIDPNAFSGSAATPLITVIE